MVRKTLCILPLLAIALAVAVFDGRTDAQDCFPCPADAIYAAGWPPNATCYWKTVEIEGEVKQALARCGTFQSPLPFESPIGQQAIWQAYLPIVLAE